MQYYFVKGSSQRVYFFTIFHSAVIHSTLCLSNRIKNFQSNEYTEIGVTI